MVGEAGSGWMAELPHFGGSENGGGTGVSPNFYTEMTR